MKKGALTQIQSRLFQRNPKSFTQAIEAEAEKPNKKQNVDSINIITNTIDKNNDLQQTVKELSTVIHQLKQKLDDSPKKQKLPTIP
jgi:hypothetical protein